MADLIVLRKCLLCQRSRVRGVSIRGHFLCAACEERLVGLACDDPAYETVRRGLKKIWRSGIAGAAGLPGCPGHGRIRAGRSC